ncbi:hypothetical protein VMCG_04280 [Cytospora schulzeri]|uniref:Uncharacterized protein n=1 Tax=Cytospora schulzeri TaxID=448051 RepID=A0A423WS79_9PEZI|nr:hypothetical protein VMCG_04280 [Valsa malicola]
MSAPTPPGNMIYDPIRQSLPESTNAFSPNFPQPNVSAIRFSATNPNRIAASSHAANLTPGSRSGLTPEVGPGTPGSETRLQILSGLASGNHVLPPLSSPFTPSSNYESSGLPGASPSNSLTDPPTSSSHHQQQRTGQLNAPTASHSSTEVHGSYAHDFAPNGLTSSSYSYLGGNCGPITDAITVEEINIGSLGLPNDMMPPWDFFPSDFTGLFDVHSLGEGNHGQI